MTGAARICGDVVVSGEASGPLVYSTVPLSFWGGVDPETGRVIDQHHPLKGRSLTGCVLAVPTSRGSCSGSGVVLELVLNGCGPSAILLERPEAIISLGVIVAQEVFGQSIPVRILGPDGFAALCNVHHVSLEPAHKKQGAQIALSDHDRAIEAGEHGEAARIAMQIVLRLAALEGARDLLDVTQSHIDGCIYTGPGGLAFAERLRELGGKVAVPTTLNAISVDQRRWRQQGVDEAFGSAASRLADAYVAMGARPSFTCAPYVLQTAPKRDEQIVWAESNAVVYANSVLGARTMKYPDYLDICIALTGRAPKAGCHLDSGRQPQLHVQVPELKGLDDSFYPLLGYLIGSIATDEIPLIEGLERAMPSSDDLKAFGAAFATSSAAPMFHIAGVTPEAMEPAAFAALSLKTVQITIDDLRAAWDELNGAAIGPVDLVSLGNPHFSLSEIAALAKICEDRKTAATSSIIVTCGRAVLDEAIAAGHVAELESFGVSFVTDTCWCMIGEPIIPPAARVIMTNSGKYAHYGPGLSGRDMRFGSLADCVEAAVTGECRGHLPGYLS